ncbi:putative bifunctional diguanylate cyclase/phosphodiesterase [Piscinibacter gummiphilus]|uniref:Diguanylate phosphodiesterase n=1 Tax=Piscinibacter gummiphilus TaxID=946333 RepID=A0A1W6L3Z2_9BURK|nr:EAL domain-containing protein [Piscinibacter gummiphilus]ARN18952.1 diguanylate phosphodiesterase [Piscinibacter gummiphilus]ATU63597.1 GGDEF domain-containing protein [Piscinibacter gummiphilus]
MNEPRALLDRDLPEPEAWPCLLACLADDGAVLQANREFTRHLGIAHETHPGWVWSALLTPDSLAALQAALPRRADFALTLVLKGTPQAPDGTWLDGRARWDAEGARYLCTFQDVSDRVRAEGVARDRADQFQLLADNVPVLIAYFEAGTFACRFANRQYAATFGWDEASILGRPFREIIGDAATREIQPYVDMVLRDKVTASYERELVGRNGQTQWLEVNLIPHLGPDGEPAAAFVLIADITRHRAAERALQETQDRLSKFLQASAEGIAFLQDGVITDVNPAACQLVGFPPEELVGMRTLDIVAADQRAKVSDMIRAGNETPYESALVHKSGLRLPVELMGRSMTHKGERVRMTIVRDIRERYAAQEHIRYLAHHDALTGLPNRVSLMEDLSHQIAAARRSDSQFALLFIDLDHFKRVNDSLGHLVGDTLLQTISRRITDCLRTTDRVARFGGDEFIVLLPNTLQRSDVEEVSNKLLAAIEVPVNVDGRLISVTPSIGISMFPHDAGTADALIKNADTAMYLAKSRGRANHQFFTPAMARSALDALVMESQMAQGLARGEFVLHFQPQVSAADGRLLGAEALMRWHHPERGLLMPDAFIELAEQQRLMLPLGQWALREAARCAKRWHDAGIRHAPVAVNLSSVQFQTSGFTALVEQMLLEEDVSGTLVELEITERMLMDDLPEVRRKLTELKALGIRIAVDDFGTGYSSLAHLKELPIDKMKIDRSFVHDLPGDPESNAIARAIIQMSRGLGLKVIAEGVETAAQREFLQQAGCDELQGLLVSGPLTEEAFEAWALGLKVTSA